jgi:hypothetical protein
MSKAVCSKAVWGRAHVILSVLSAAVCASLVLVGCGGDDGGPPDEPTPDSKDKFGLSKQIYLVGRSGNDYVKQGNSTDNAEVSMRIRGSTGRYDTLPAGSIKDGKLSLNLPAITDSIYYMKFCAGIEGACPLTITPQTLIVSPFVESLIVRGRSNCRLGLGVIKSGVVDRNYGGSFLYALTSGTVTGTDIRHGSDEDYGFSYALNLSQGWNLVFGHDAGVIEYYSTNALTDTPLEWCLICN